MPMYFYIIEGIYFLNRYLFKFKKKSIVESTLVILVYSIYCNFTKLL